MKFKNFVLATVAMGYGAMALSQEFQPKAPPCEAKEACQEIYDKHERCVQTKNSKSCLPFIKSFQKFIEKKQCPHGPTVILGLCTGNNFEKYLGTLSTLNFKQARVFFASKKLRDSLDGALVEEFEEKSLQAESDLKKAQK